MAYLGIPESTLAARTKPGLAGPIVLALLWFVFGALLFIIILGLLTGTLGKNETALLLFFLIAYSGGVIGLGMAIQARRAWSKRNNWDYSASRALDQRLRDIGGRSEPACREYITHLLSAIGATFGAGSHVDETFRRYAPQLAASFPCDVAHVSDQLRAMLRQSPERRPTVSVVGEDLGGAAILGGAICVGADGPWQQLFPLSRNRAILSAAEGLKKGSFAYPPKQIGEESLSEAGRDLEGTAFPAGDKLSPEDAARAIGVTPGTLRGYVRSGRVQANPDGTINTGELRRAGLIIRNS